LNSQFTISSTAGAYGPWPSFRTSTSLEASIGLSFVTSILKQSPQMLLVYNLKPKCTLPIVP
jgi:hypothetical protein